MYLFTDPDARHRGVEDVAPMAKRPFPYEPCRKVTLRGLTAASGKKPRLSPNAEMTGSTVVIEKE